MVPRVALALAALLALASADSPAGLATKAQPETEAAAAGGGGPSAGPATKVAPETEVAAAGGGGPSAGAAAKTEPEIQAAAAGGDANACTRGIVGQLHNVAPICLDACASSCEALGQAVSAFLRGGPQGVWGVVCVQQGAFMCLVSDDNRRSCQPLLAKATALGVPLPESSEDLTRRCQ